MILKGRLIKPQVEATFDAVKKVLRLRFDDAHEHNLAFWMEIELTEADMEKATEAKGSTVLLEVQKIP